jgi:hypothetical protein
MSHYAKVLNGVVVKVITAEADFFDTFIDNSPGQWIQTSYNTFAGQHKLGGEPLRGNFAGIGSIYDSENDVFYPPKPADKNGLPCNSWTLSTTTWLWEPPVPHPTDNKFYFWDEPTLSWVELV